MYCCFQLHRILISNSIHVLTSPFIPSYQTPNTIAPTNISIPISLSQKKAKKSAEREGKVKERAAVKVQMSQITEDLAEATKALDAANAFLKGVKEQCANKAMSYEERQKRRADEIKGLQEALKILSADEGEFLQTGFMSRK